MNSSIGAKTLSDEDWDILSQCLLAAVEGPFFKGLCYVEDEFPFLIGANWDQLRLILRYWPDLDARQLYVEYEKLDVTSDKHGPCHQGTHNFEPPSHVPMPTRLRIFSVVDHCLYLLTDYVVRPVETERQKRALNAWNEYVNVTPQKAQLATGRWQWLYRPLKLEDGD